MKSTKITWIAKWMVKWLLVPFVWGVYLLSPDLRARGIWIYTWLVVYLVYLVVLEVLSRVWKLYETPVFRMIRIQVMAFFGSALIILTGGAESCFWFVYLWSLFAVAFYFMWVVIWAIYGEVAVLYFLSSLVAAGGLASINVVLLLINLIVLLLLTAVFHYLTASIRAAESERKYSSLLEQIQQDVDTAIDLQEVLNRILRRAVELVGARDGTLMLTDETGELHFRARFGGSLPADKVERTFKPGEGVAGWVVQNHRPYICHDTKTDAHFTSIIDGKPIRSLVSVPIILHGTVLGVINVDSTEPNRFSEADARLLVTLASQTAVAIERAELLESLKQIGEKTFGGAEDLYQYIVDAVHRLTRCPVAMWLLDETGRRASIAAFREVRTEHVQQAVVDLDFSVTGRAIREREIVQVLDIQADPVFQNKEEAAREGWQSMLAVPLLAGPERAVGTLSIYSKVKREGFTPWELDLLRVFASQAGVVIQNTGLIGDLRRRNEELEVLNEIGQAVSVLGIEAIANLVYQQASQLMDTTNFFLCLYDKEKEELHYRIWMYHGQSLEPFSRELSGLTGWVVREKEPLLISDWDKEEESFPVEADIVTGRQRSWLGVPLLIGEEVIGVISVQSSRPCAFDSDTQRLLETIASQAAIAIQNARLFDNAQSRIRDLEIVNNIVQIINTKLDTQDLLRTIVSQIADQLRCTHCTLFHPQKEKGELLLVPQVTHGMYSERLMTRSFKPGEGLAGWVFQQGESLVLADARDDPRFAPARAHQDRPRSMLVAPVKVGDQTTGVISADQDEFGWFSESDKRLVDALGQQAGIAIQRAASLDLLQDIGNGIINGQKVDDILQQIVSGAIELTNTTSGAIYLVSEDGKSVIQSFQYPPDFRHPKPRIDRKEGLTRQVVATGETLIFPDIRQDDRVNPVLRDRIRSVIAVPLKLEQRVIGVLYLNDADPHDFTDTEVSLLSTLANQAAVAIENARVYEELKQAYKELEQAQEQRSWAVLGKTAGSLAHRIGNKGGIVRVCAGDLADRLQEMSIEDEMLDEKIGMIQRNTQYLLEMSDLLFKPVEATRASLEKTDISLLVSDAIKSLDIPEDVTVEVQEDISKLPQVPANKFFVEVFTEIINNALVAMESLEEKRLIIGGQVAGGYAEIRFTDTGPGIPPDDQKVLFDLFTRLSDREPAVLGHRGFGLWWVKSFLASIGGEIWCESTPDKGSTFIVKLPLES